MLKEGLMLLTYYVMGPLQDLPPPQAWPCLKTFHNYDPLIVIKNINYSQVKYVICVTTRTVMQVHLTCSIATACEMSMGTILFFHHSLKPVKLAHSAAYWTVLFLTIGSLHHDKRHLANQSLAVFPEVSHLFSKYPVHLLIHLIMLPFHELTSFSHFYIFSCCSLEEPFSLSHPVYM